jgi:hypothetical protein
MAENLLAESPRFPEIRKEAGIATRDGLQLLWRAINFEAQSRKQGVNQAKHLIAPKLLSDDPGSQQNNYDLKESSLVLLTGSVNRIFTGFRAPSTGETRVVIVMNTGSATYTFNHLSGSSDAENQFRNGAGANLAVATDRSVIYVYAGLKWRELKLV